MNFKVIAVALLVFDILWQGFLELLDRRSLKRAVPVCVADVYNLDEYAKWRAYKSEKSRVGILQALVCFVAELLLLVLDGYAAFARLFPAGVYPQLLSIVLLEQVVSTVAALPFSVYDTFTVEAKYGFNRSTRKTFVADEIKGFLLSTVLMGGLISLFAVIHQAMGDWVIVLFAVVFVLIMLCITLLAPLFTRLFNKFTPLPDGELKEKLTALMTAHGYKVRAIEVMDASKRSTKMNAYFTGFGPMKTIVLYDTLVEATTPDQLCAVFAHELGHGLHHDTLTLQCFSGLNAVLIAVIAWLLVRTPAIFADFGFTEVNYGMVFSLMGGVMGLLSPLMGLLSNTFSRKAEYRADAQAVSEGYGENLIAALKLLAKGNFADLAPDPLLVRLIYSHPAMDQRIEAIQAAMGKK